MTKTLASNIFYHFLFAVSLGNRASKMSEKNRLDRKIGFQNTFYTKSINVTIDSIGPSIILRSIVPVGQNQLNCPPKNLNFQLLNLNNFLKRSAMW